MQEFKAPNGLEDDSRLESLETSRIVMACGNAISQSCALTSKGW